MVSLSKEEAIDYVSALSISSSSLSSSSDTTATTASVVKKGDVKVQIDPCTTSVELLLKKSELLLLESGLMAKRCPPSFTSSNSTMTEGESASGSMGTVKVFFGDSDDDPNNSSNDQDENTNKWKTRLVRAEAFFSKNLLPDNKVCIGRYQIVDSKEAIRLFKFLFLTISLVISMHFFSRFVNWEYDPSYTIIQLIQEDMNDVVIDSIAFFVVGRLYKRKGVDRLFPFILPMTCSCLIISWSTTDVWFLKNSITWYNIRYVWPWQLHVFTLVCMSLLIICLGLHIVFSIKDGTFIYRSLEISLLVLMFVIPHIVPHISDEDFHLHHWYSFWLFGVLCNREEWWSQFAMALSWGTYINGISVYGRDSIYPTRF